MARGGEEVVAAAGGGAQARPGLAWGLGVRLLFLCGLGRREKGGRGHGDRGRGCCSRSLLPLALRQETEREREERWLDGVDEAGQCIWG